MRKSLVLTTVLLSVWALPATASGRPPCPAGTVTTDTHTCALSNGTVPPKAVESAIRAVAATQAKRSRWQFVCNELGPAGKQFAYQCILYTPDPGGTTSMAVNGKLEPVSVHASYLVMHNGCVYSVKALLAITATIVPNGCGAAGLARIRAAVSG